MNRVELVGRLTTKPELRYTGSNVPFTRFTVAVNRTFSNQNGERETDFINCVIWRKQAANVCNYLNKGSLVSVEGRIQTGSYDYKDGNKRYTTDVVCDSVQFLESKNAQQGQAQVAPTPTYQQPVMPVQESTFDDSFSAQDTVDIASDDLPF